MENKKIRDRFKTKMLELCITYQREVTDPMLAVFWVLVEKYGIEKFSKACNKHIYGCENSSKFFPKPADLIQILEGTKTDQSALAWNQVIKSMRQIGSWGSPIFQDSRISETINRMGGWLVLCKSVDEELPYREREFCRCYEALIARGYRENAFENKILGTHDLQNGNIISGISNSQKKLKHTKTEKEESKNV